MDAGEWIAVVTGLLGLSGLIFAGLHFRSDDTKAIVDSQSAVLKDMAALNDEQRQVLRDLRSERDELRGEVAALREQVQRLSHERP